MKKKLGLILVLFFLIFVLSSCGYKPRTTIRIGMASLSTNVNPFLYTTEAESDFVSLSYVRLFPTDRLGNTIYDASYTEGKMSLDGETYYSFATMSYSNKIYTIKIRDDMYSYTGELITTNDVMFDYYVLLDPSLKKVMKNFTGSWQEKLQSLPITGYSEYVETITAPDKEVSQEEKSAAYIEGIIEDQVNHTITIKTDRVLTEEEKALLNIYVAPVKQYTDSTSYSVLNHIYGFKKGDVSKIPFTGSLTLDSTGPFILKNYSYNEFNYDKNSVYDLTSVKPKKLRFMLITGEVRDEDNYVTSGGSIYYQIYKSWMDFGVVNPQTIESQEAELLECSRYNFNDTETGNCISTVMYKDKGYNMDDSLGFMVYSTKRVSKEAVDSFYISEHYSFIRELTKIK